MKNSLLGVLLFFTSVSMANSQVVFPLRKIPTTLDPQAYEDIYSMVGMIQVHRGLLKFLPNLEIAPDLAESFKVLDGGKRLVFNLGTTKFSNGEVITADHVVRSFQRMFRDKRTFAEDLNYIKNGDAILKGKADYKTLAVKAIDPKTVEIDLDHPCGVVLSHLATIDSAIIPVDSKLNYDWQKNGGAGAYVIESVIGKTMTLKARAAEVDSKAPQKIIFKELSEPEALAAALKGEIDSLDGYSASKETTEKLLSLGWRSTVSTLTRQLFLVMNPNKINLKTREVIANALAAKKFDLMSPSYKHGAGIIPFGLAGAFAPPTPHELEVKPFKKEVKISLLIVNAEPLIPYLADQIKNELKRWNISLTVKVIGMTDYIEAVRKKPYDIMLRSKHLDYPDGYSILTYFRSNYSENTFFIKNKKIDLLLDRALEETDTQKRADLYREIQKLVLAEHTLIPLVFGSNNLGLWSKKVAEVPAHPLGVQGLPFENLRVTK